MHGVRRASPSRSAPPITSCMYVATQDDYLSHQLEAECERMTPVHPRIRFFKSTSIRKTTSSPRAPSLSYRYAASHSNAHLHHVPQTPQVLRHGVPGRFCVPRKYYLPLKLRKRPAGKASSFFLDSISSYIPCSVILHAHLLKPACPAPPRPAPCPEEGKASLRSSSPAFLHSLISSLLPAHSTTLKTHSQARPQARAVSYVPRCALPFPVVFLWRRGAAPP
ncbi:hypothetical protein DFH06DRAFT_578773 [Mycena polygramma]|nr:hypothetical protein DFH06DRAFT_578773 [Mycena polygramma]